MDRTTLPVHSDLQRPGGEPEVVVWRLLEATALVSVVQPAADVDHGWDQTGLGLM
jgi:hypothetical protein